MARGLDAGKYFWRSGREKCFSLDIPFNRTSGARRPWAYLPGLPVIRGNLIRQVLQSVSNLAPRCLEGSSRHCARVAFQFTRRGASLMVRIVNLGFLSLVII